MSKDYESRYQAGRARVEDNADDLADPDDADRILTMLDAYDAEKFSVQCPDGQKEKTRTTLYNYTTAIRRVAEQTPLMESDAGTFNALMQAMYDGNAPNVKDSGLGANTIRNYQNGIRQFLYVHTDAEADPHDIQLIKPDDPKVDPEDMLTREEIHAMQAEANCMRDLALFNFLIYTGQRNTAARTLRIKDLDLDEGKFKLNEEAEGLKGAPDNGKWRDLLLSAETLRQYLNTEHPTYPDEPDHYVFTGRPKYAKLDASEPIGDSTIGRPIKKMAEKAAESVPSIADKPTHPHALRHNFVTIALRRGMKESAIKHQIGHSPDSRVMESTYAHLSDSDHIQQARDAFDLETEIDENPIAPEQCPRCGTAAHEAAALCGVCGLEFGPDAKDLTDEVDERIHDSKGEAAAEGDDDIEAGVDAAREILDDPDAKAAVMDELKDEIMNDLRAELGDDDDEPAAPAAAPTDD